MTIPTSHPFQVTSFKEWLRTILLWERTILVIMTTSWSNRHTRSLRVLNLIVVLFSDAILPVYIFMYAELNLNMH
jgi:hypothetical protein